MFNIFVLSCLGLTLFAGCKNETEREETKATTRYQNQKPSLLQRLQEAKKAQVEAIIKQALQDNEDLAATTKDGTNILHYLLRIEGNSVLVSNILLKYPLLINQ